MPQIFVSQPNDKCDGTYDVARWNVVKRQYEVIETGFPDEETAKERAAELNSSL